MTTYKQLQDSWIRSEWVDSNVEDFGGDELVFIPNTVSFGSVTLPDLMSKNITKTNYNDIIKIANYIMVINVDPIVDKIVNIFNNADVIYEFEDFYVISPSIRFVDDDNNFSTTNLGENGKLVTEGFEYSSGSNNHFLNDDELADFNSLAML